MSGTPDNSRRHIFNVVVFDQDSHRITSIEGLRGRKEVLAYRNKILSQYNQAQHFKIHDETAIKTTWLHRSKGKQ